MGKPGLNQDSESVETQPEPKQDSESTKTSPGSKSEL